MKDKIILELSKCYVDVEKTINNLGPMKQVVLERMEDCYDNVIKILDEK